MVASGGRCCRARPPDDAAVDRVGGRGDADAVVVVDDCSADRSAVALDEVAVN